MQMCECELCLVLYAQPTSSQTVPLPIILLGIRTGGGDIHGATSPYRNECVSHLQGLDLLEQGAAAVPLKHEASLRLLELHHHALGHRHR